MTVIMLLVVLLVCVIAHEWGHFFVAKRSGMRVEEFGFGIPPRLWAKKKGETTYSINALPIGGFVKITGENEIDPGAPMNVQFDAKPWYLKAAVLVAGVTMNIILAIVLFAIAYMIGMPRTTEGGTPTIVSATPKMPAYQAGLRVGDTIQHIQIGGKELSVSGTDELHKQVVENPTDITITYTRGDEQKTVIVTPKGEGDERMIGVAIEPISTMKASFGESIKSAWQQVWRMVAIIWQTLASLVTGIFTHDKSSVNNLIGPVGLANEVKGAAMIGFAYLLAFTAAISVNLAVLNIMPFPALDGGRLLVVLLEAITKRKFSRKVVGYIHGIGFALLLILMVVLTVGDIRRLV